MSNSRDRNEPFLHMPIRLICGQRESEAQYVDEDAPELDDAVEVPDIEALSERLRSCLQVMPD